MKPKDKIIDNLPSRSWHERINVLNILLIVFFSLTIFSGKNLIDQNRPADVVSGFQYFIKKFFPPDFSNLIKFWNHLMKLFK